MLLFSPEAWWSSLDPSMLLRHILVFKNALAFILENHLVDRSNPGVKNLLEALKLLYKVRSARLFYCLLFLQFCEDILLSSNLSVLEIDERNWSTETFYPKDSF